MTEASCGDCSLNGSDFCRSDCRRDQWRPPGPGCAPRVAACALLLLLACRICMLERKLAAERVFAESLAAEYEMALAALAPPGE